MPTVTDTSGIWAIWYWPAPGRGATKVDGDEPASDLQYEIVATGASGRSAGGSYSTITLGAYFKGRLISENFRDHTLKRDLLSFEVHAKRGGAFQLSSNTVKAWAGFGSKPLGPGDTIIQTQGSSFPSGVQTDGLPDVELVAGDEVVIQSAWPESTIEFATISAHDGKKVTLAEGLRYYHQPPVLVRHIEFHPVVNLAPEARSRPIVTSDHGWGYTLDLAWEENSQGWASVAGLGGAPLNQPDGNGGGRIDLDTLLNRNNLGAGTGKKPVGGQGGGKWFGAAAGKK